MKFAWLVCIAMNISATSSMSVSRGLTITKDGLTSASMTSMRQNSPVNVDYRRGGTFTVPLPRWWNRRLPSLLLQLSSCSKFAGEYLSLLNDGRFDSWSAVPSIKISPCCYNANTCLRGQKCNYTVIDQSDSFRRNSADFKFVCMQVYQTLLLLRERGSGSETTHWSPFSGVYSGQFAR